MSISRKSVAWLVLASYLFANTVAASLHDHGDCCSASPTGAHDRHAAHDHVAQHHGHRYAGHDHPGHGSHCGGATGHDDAGIRLLAPHHCVVCEFFAQAPLRPPAAGLIRGGDLPPGESPRPVILVSRRSATTHFARVPPALA